MSVAEALDALMTGAIADTRSWSQRATQEAEARRSRIAVAAEHIGDRAEALATHAGGLTVDDVRRALRSGRELSARERRVVVVNWPTFHAQLAAVVRDDDSLVRLLRRQLFQQFRSFRAAEHEAVHALVAAWERRTGELIGSASTAEWLQRGPAGVGLLLARHEPARWERILAKEELRSGWDFTDAVRVEAFSTWLSAQPSAARALEQLQAVPELSSRFCPPREQRGQETHRFWATAEWPRVVCAWLVAAEARPADASSIDSWLLETSLRDPLSPRADRIRWHRVKDTNPAAHGALLTRLSRSDIEFFFQQVQGYDAQERGKFWLQYLDRVRQTQSFLSSNDRAAATAQVQRSQHPAHALALKRAGQVASDASVFVLWFDNIVVVEFSKTGNATYLYSRQAFEAMRPMWSGPSPGVTAFKDKALAIGTLNHMSGWQYRYRHALRDLKI